MKCSFGGAGGEKKGEVSGGVGITLTTLFCHLRQLQ